eukprot:UN24138
MVVTVPSPELQLKIKDWSFELSDCEVNLMEMTCRQTATFTFKSNLVCDISGLYTFSLWGTSPNFDSNPDALKPITLDVDAPDTCSVDFGSLTLTSSVETYEDEAYSIQSSDFPLWSRVYMRSTAISPYREI